MKQNLVHALAITAASVTASFAVINPADQLAVGDGNSDIVVASTAQIDAEFGTSGGIDDTYTGQILFDFTIEVSNFNQGNNWGGFQLFNGGENLAVGCKYGDGVWGGFNGPGNYQLNGTGGTPDAIVSGEPKAFQMVINYVAGGDDTATITLGGTDNVMVGDYSFTEVQVRGGVGDPAVQNGKNFTGMSIEEIVVPPGPPTWNEPINMASVFVNEPYNETFVGKITDPNGDVITYSKLSSDAWISLASTGEVTGTPPVAGTSSLTFIATANGDSATGTVNIVVGGPLSGIVQYEPMLTTASDGADALRINESNDTGGWINTLNTRGGTVYIAFDWNITDNNAETGSGGFFGGLSINTDDTEKLLIGNDWNSLNYALLKFTDVSDTAIPYVLNTTVRLVCKLEMVTNGDDSAFLFVDQATEGVADATRVGDYSFNTLIHRTGNGTGSSDLENLVVATTYDEAYYGPSLPPAPVWITIESSDTEVILSWTALDRKTYGVEIKNNLIAGNWLPLTNGLEVVGGGTLSYTNAVGSDPTFYQVISE